MAVFAAVVDWYGRRAAYHCAGIAIIAASGVLALRFVPHAFLPLAVAYALAIPWLKRRIVKRTRRLTRVTVDANGLYEGDAVLARRSEIHQIAYRSGRPASLVRLRGVAIQVIVYKRDMGRFAVLQPDTARYLALTASPWRSRLVMAVMLGGCVAAFVMCDDRYRPDPFVDLAGLGLGLALNWPRRVAVSRTALDWPRALWGRRRIALADIIEIAPIRRGIAFRTADRRSYRFMAFDRLSAPSFFHRIQAIAPVEVDALLN